ncbi:MAG: Tetratrico peptide repeat protein [Rariglobus sp.]|jgi:tetratricopeptide (TPR) repeat protein|nr:Tetratrico peptide repeat protein [Rariglobus sp.]
MSDWKPELDAIVGARHGGRTEHLLDLLRKLDARHPHVAEINYQLAWTLETGGKFAEALPYYEKAVTLGLAPNEHSNALIGLAGTLRQLGDARRAAEVLRSGRLQFPDNREFDVFLALALHDLGEHTEAMQLVLTALADTTEDPGLSAYQRTIRHMASRL